MQLQTYEFSAFSAFSAFQASKVVIYMPMIPEADSASKCPLGWKILELLEVVGSNCGDVTC